MTDPMVPGAPLDDGPQLEKTEWGQAKVYRFDQMPAEVSSTTYRRSAIRGDDAIVCLNYFEPGNPPWPLHSHPFDQIAFILSGRMLVRLADQEIEVESPSAIWIPKDMPHCANILGDEPCLNLDVFGVVREDFLHLVEYQGEWTSVDGAASP